MNTEPQETVRPAHDLGARPTPAGAAAVDVAVVIDALIAAGAREITHPGGTLLAHLRRVHALLGQWDARPALRLAGLCHAYYGTDGFATALGDVALREDLIALIGAEAEELVYLYCGCDRDFSYARLAEDGGGFRDRFTGTTRPLPAGARRDFAELTVANELDVLRADPELRARYGPGLRDLFASWRDLLSAPARRSAREILG